MHALFNLGDNIYPGLRPSRQPSFVTSTTPKVKQPMRALSVPVDYRLLLAAGIVLLAIAGVGSQASAQQYFSTLPPHAILPSGEHCAAEIPSTPETVPDNTPFNHTTATRAQLLRFAAEGYTFEHDSNYEQFKRITGDYTGTTDMIMRWAACKYGIDENVVRGQAWKESAWRQREVGDKRLTRAQCVQGFFTALWNSTIPLVDGRSVTCHDCCWQSWSAWQTKVYYEWRSWPMMKDSTSFAADYRFAETRACINGDMAPYFAPRPRHGGRNTYSEDINAYAERPTPENLDKLLWGCIGVHYSGQWYDDKALHYIGLIKDEIAHKRWLTPEIHNKMND